MKSLWRTTKIGEIADLGSGGTPSRAQLDRYYTNGTIWWVKTGDLNNDRIRETEEKITQVAVNESSCRVYPPGTLLIAMYGGFNQIGRTGLLVIEAAINQALTAISVDPNVVAPDYLQQWLNAQVAEWKKLAGSSRKDPNITKAEVAAFPIILPPLPEQRAIAAVLSAWDRAIRQTTDLLDAKRRLKRGLMQQLLTGKRRFPGFLGEWKVTAFGAFLKESRNLGSNGAAAKKLTVKLYGKGVVAKHESRSGSAATQYYRRSRGQFIYSKLDFLNGAFGIVPDHLDGYESTLDLPAFDIGQQVNPNWLREFVCRPEFYSNLLGLANGGRKARRVNPDDFLKVRVALPSLAEQRKIAGLLNAIDCEITLLTQQLAALKTQKRGLMRKLLTGEVRVKVPS